MKKVALICLSLVVATGCIHGFRYNQPSWPRYQDAINSWVGAPISEVLQVWRDDPKIVDLENGKKQYRWFRAERYQEGVDIAYIDAETHELREDRAARYWIGCTTVLTVDSDGIVINADNARSSDECGLMFPPKSRPTPTEVPQVAQP